MSCFIEGMDKPKICMECPFADDTKYNFDHYCTRLNRRVPISESRNGVLEDCPIKDHIPHKEPWIEDCPIRGDKGECLCTNPFTLCKDMSEDGCITLQNAYSCGWNNGATYEKN